MSTIERQPSPHGSFEITESKGKWSRRYIFDDGYTQQPFQKSQNHLQELIVPVGYPTSVERGYFRFVIFSVIMEAANMMMLVMSVSAILRINPGHSAAFFVVFREVMTGMMHLIITERWGTSIVFFAKQWRMRIELISELLRIIEIAFISTPIFYSISVTCSVIEGVLQASRQVIKTRILNNYAKGNNVAELTEKVQNLETLFRVVSLLIGWVILHVLGDFTESGIIVFICALISHCICNFLLSNVIVFKTLNYERLTILMSYFMNIKNEILSPVVVSRIESKIKVNEMVNIRMGISLNSIPKSSDLYIEISQSIKKYQYYLYKTSTNQIWVILGDHITKDEIFESLLCAYSQLVIGWDENRKQQVKDWDIVGCLKEKGWDIENLDVRIGAYRIQSDLLKF
ncbi:hypothetical protein ENUP19_0159G0022 [Entamoeba nuttalli]|uniref:Protein root UVB sensitive/RUS domain-containing protein n=2 Tax=Entamoeba nuttalli TaxID=412467 RepID=K2G496_ENTNP|nr:hypothetical protein ENU1_209440 [Entamoeba nuttalli P19]EKE37096.1 hypothetical protein ENU1_209440 [Entamoeba nuttalli P19]|eukprot:XP_008860558.1 hypothetical protein ENU1_209440 [Entamoeba nuttalli P19]